MMIEYRCCFCRELYDWYEGIYKNPNYNLREEIKARRKGEEYTEKSGNFIAVNGFTLCQIQPINDNVSADCAIEAEPPKGNLNVYLNVCPKCMREILNNLYPTYKNVSAWDQ